MVLSMAALGLIAVFTRILVAQGTSSHQTVANLVADSALRRAERVGPPHWGAPLGAPWIEKATVGRDSEQVDFNVRVTASALPESSESELFETGSDMGDLWLVQSEVWWSSDSNGPRGQTGRGEQRVKVGRLVYIER